MKHCPTYFRFSVTLPALWAAWLVGPICLTGQTVDLGTFNRESETAVRPVAVTSTDPQIDSLMRRAFGMHGAYQLVPEERAAFVFRFSPTGSTGVQLTIESGRPAQRLFTQETAGAGWREAALRAADLAVMKTSAKLPGIFASRVAFVSNRSGATEIYLSDLLFDEVRQLTRDGSKCALPELSPNGNMLLYTTYHKGGFPDLFAIDLSTGRRSIFAGYQGTNTGGAFNPSGSMVALILCNTGNAELYLANAVGKNLRRMTRTAALESEPTWAPDGNRLVYASDAPGGPQLYEIPVSGGSPRRLPTNISGYCAEPNWNPRQPELIAFTTAAGREFEVAIFDFTTRQSRVLTNGPGDAVEPRWLRDGRHLVYTERTSKYRRLMLLDTVSGKKSPLHDQKFGNTSQAACAYPAR